MPGVPAGATHGIRGGLLRSAVRLWEALGASGPAGGGQGLPRECLPIECPPAWDSDSALNLGGEHLSPWERVHPERLGADGINAQVRGVACSPGIHASPRLENRG